MLIPNSRVTKISIEGRLHLKIWIPQPALENRANEALIRLLSKKLSIPQSCFRLTHGKTSRQKNFSVSGISEEELFLRCQSMEIARR